MFVRIEETRALESNFPLLVQLNSNHFNIVQAIADGIARTPHPSDLVRGQG